MVTQDLSLVKIRKHERNNCCQKGLCRKKQKATPSTIWIVSCGRYCTFTLTMSMEHGASKASQLVYNTFIPYFEVFEV